MSHVSGGAKDTLLAYLEHHTMIKVDQLNHIFTVLNNKDKLGLDRDQFRQLMEDMDN